MITKQEFIEGVRRGWEKSEFGQGRFRDSKTNKCCAVGAYLLGTGAKICLHDPDGFEYFDQDAVNSLIFEAGGSILDTVTRVNDGIDSSKYDDPKAEVLSRLERIAW
jgi:hypothetical protein